MLTKKVYEELELLSRHIRVLEVVMNNQPIGITRIAKMLRIEEYEVRHSLSVLEDNGLILPTPSGAIVQEDVKGKLLSMAEDLHQMEDTMKLLRSMILKLVV